MFFIIGVSNGQKDLTYTNAALSICKGCGAYCRCRVYCIYMSFTLFFIPMFKWSKKYYVECLNCGTRFSLNKEIGKKIEYGDNVIISPDDLEASTTFSNPQYRKCFNCGYETELTFEYCPKCGNKL